MGLFEPVRLLRKWVIVVSWGNGGLVVAHVDRWMILDRASRQCVVSRHKLEISQYMNEETRDLVCNRFEVAYYIQKTRPSTYHCGKKGSPEPFPSGRYEWWYSHKYVQYDDCVLITDIHLTSHKYPPRNVRWKFYKDYLRFSEKVQWEWEHWKSCLLDVSQTHRQSLGCRSFWRSTLRIQGSIWKCLQVIHLTFETLDFGSGTKGQ